MQDEDKFKVIKRDETKETDLDKTVETDLGLLDPNRMAFKQEDPNY